MNDDPNPDVVAVSTNNPDVLASADTTNDNTLAVNSENTSGNENPDMAVALTNEENQGQGSLTVVSLGGGETNATSNASAAAINTDSTSNGSNGDTNVSVAQSPDGAAIVTVNVTTNTTDNTSGNNAAAAGVVVAGCLSNQFRDASGICQNCDANCLACVDAPNKCTSCGSNFTLVNYQCTCPAGQYQSGGSCLTCGAQCSSCDANGVCLGCTNGYFNQDGRCVCLAGNYESNGNCYCNL